MVDRSLLKYFWNCGDNSFIEFAIIRARLNAREKEAVRLLLDECKSQEEAAEEMLTSVRNFQNIWYSASDKLLSIPWLYDYAETIKEHEKRNGAR